MQNNIQEVQPFDAAAFRQELARTLTGSDEIDALVSQITVDDLQSIVTFGSSATREIAQNSDAILRGVNAQQASDSGPLLTALGRVMAQFNARDFSDSEKKGVFSKLFKSRETGPDQLLSKYQKVGGEVDKVYIELKKYEAEITAFNQKLQAVVDANVGCYRQLVKYVLAGEQGLGEMDAYLTRMRSELALRPGDAVLQMDLDTMQRARAALERRVQDLRIAEVVALQAIPMLQTMQRSNLNVVRKIDTAFLVTLPVFKQALGQAVQLKRQRLQNQAMRALDERTADSLRRYEQSAAAQNATAQNETLEQTWRTIVNGIEEVYTLQADAAARRSADAAQLDTLRQQLQT